MCYSHTISEKSDSSSNGENPAELKKGHSFTASVVPWSFQIQYSPRRSRGLPSLLKNHPYIEKEFMFCITQLNTHNASIPQYWCFKAIFKIKSHNVTHCQILTGLVWFMSLKSHRLVCALHLSVRGRPIIKAFARVFSLSQLQCASKCSHLINSCLTETDS